MERLDLYEMKDLVYKAMHNRKIPLQVMEETFQEFAVYFYSYYKYDDAYKPSSYIYLMFSNFLSVQAKKYKTKNLVMESLVVSMDDKREDWRDWIQLQNEDFAEMPTPDLEVYCDELMSKFKPLTKEYILDRGVCQRRAKEEGVTRQAIENRVKHDMEKVLKTL